MKESEIKSVLRSLLARGYMKRQTTVVKRYRTDRVISMREMIFNFKNLDVDREIQRISREYCERYRAVGKYFFVSFRSSDQIFFKAGRVFEGSYRV